LQFFAYLKSAKNSAVFDSHKYFEKKKYFRVTLEPFANFEAKGGENGAKKGKIVFFKHVLELLFATIPGTAYPSC